MYDNLGTEQVKLFYVPIFMKSSEQRKNNATTWHSGGRMRYFSEGDDLPLQTLYYKYPIDFMIVDLDFEETDVWIVREGKLQRQTVLAELKKEDMITPIFDVYGGEMNITSLQDFYDFQKERTAFRKQRKELELHYFPNGSLHMIRHNLSEYESKKPLWLQEEKKLDDVFYDTWFPKGSHHAEKRFGEAIDCYIFLKGRRDHTTIGNLSPKEEYEACFSYVKEMIEENPSIVEDYTTWLDNENLLEEIDFYSLLQDFQ